MRVSPLALLLAGMVGAALTAAVTVIASAVAFGGAGGYVVVEPAAGHPVIPPGWVEANRVVSPSIRDLAPEPESEPDGLVGEVRARLADPAYASALLRDEPRALRFLFETALELDRPEEAWDVLERHPIFAARLDRGAWSLVVAELEAGGSERADLARASAEELFGVNEFRRR